MSDPAAFNPAASRLTTTQSDIDPGIGLMLRVADHLIPLFANGSIDIPLARQMALSAIEAYAPETRADYVNVARTIAFSISALALLGQAAAPDLPMPDKMRAFSRANALNRSADQSERTMMQRRHYHQDLPRPDHSPQPRSSQTPPSPDPLPSDAATGRAADAVVDAVVEAAVAEAMAIALGHAKPAPAEAGTALYTPSAAAPRANASPQPEPLWGVPQKPASAIHPQDPMPDAARSRAAQHKERPLRHSTIPHAVEHGNVAQPAWQGPRVISDGHSVSASTGGLPPH